VSSIGGPVLDAGTGLLDGALAPRPARGPELRRFAVARLASGPFAAFLVVFAASLTFGVWMAARGFRWGDAISRAASALAVVHSADPKLANIGFVWPPGPTLLDTFGALFYPIWPGVVTSGVSAAFSTALGGGATAALLVMTARRVGLSNWLGWGFALLVAANPMLFLYSSNGMSEGVAAPCLIGAVCCLSLFWHTGERMWIAAAGVALALGVATVYQAVAYGAAVCAALVAGILWSSEARASAPQGRARAIEGLGLLLVVPPAFVGLLWIGFNAVIMGNPLEFIYGPSGYSGFQQVAQTLSRSGGPPSVAGDVVGALALVGERTGPFLIPLAFVLLARAVDRRFWRINSLSLMVLGLSVSLGMVVPMAVLGSDMSFLRYHMFALFAAAGWGLYEISLSRRRRAVVALILAGWVAAFPATLWIMSSPKFGQQERGELMALVKGGDGQDVVSLRAPIARYLDAHVLPSGRSVVFDPDRDGGDSFIAIQIRSAYTRQLILTYNTAFKEAVAHPGRHNVGYFLMPDPGGEPSTGISHRYPRLWNGQQPGFRLLKTFTTPLERWRLFAVLSGVAHAPRETGAAQ
jgi:hypothetical protein